MKQRLLRLSSLRQAQPSKLNKFPSDDTNNTEQRRPHAESPLFFVGLRSYGCAARNDLLYHFCAKGLTCGARCAIISFVERRRNGGTGRRPGLKIPWDENPVPVRSRFPAPIRRTLESPFGTYRGVEQLVARRAHNPEVRRFKSPPRNQQVAPKKISVLKTQKPQRFLGFFMPIFKVEFKRYHFPKSTFGEDLN